MKNKVSIFLLPLLLCVCLHHNLQAGEQAVENIKQAGKIALVTGTICAGLYGIYKFACWLFRASDERIIGNAEVALSRTAEYRPILCALYHGQTTDERLEATADLLSGTVKTLHEYRSALLATSRACHQAMQDLNERMTELEQKILARKKFDQTYHQLVEQRQTMERLCQDLAIMAPQLDELSTCLSTYESYFVLHGLLESAHEQYVREIIGLRTQGTTQQYDEHIDRCIMDSAAQYGYAYPYITYVDMLTNTVSDIRQRMHELNALYVGVALCTQAQELVDMLEQIRSTAVRGGEQGAYYRERERKRIDDIKREELRIQRDLACAKEREAHAKERAAGALERTARAKEQEAREKGYENWMNPENTWWNRATYDLTH